MNYIILAQLVSLALVCMVGPYVLSLLIRTAINDRGYSMTAVDYLIGISIAVLIYFGIPSF